jgi:hypothetical protein
VICGTGPNRDDSAGLLSVRFGGYLSVIIMLADTTALASIDMAAVQHEPRENELLRRDYGHLIVTGLTFGQFPAHCEEAAGSVRQRPAHAWSGRAGKTSCFPA